MKRFYFQNYEDSDLQTCDVWHIAFPGSGQLSRLSLASGIARKVRVAWIRFNSKYDLLSGHEPLPGLLFSAEHAVGWGHIVRYGINSTIAIRILKDEPLLVSDCVQFLDENGERKNAIGWVD